MEITKKGYVMKSKQSFSEYYETIRQRFNRFADERCLGEQIDALLAAEEKAGCFNHTPHILHLVTDGANLAGQFVSDKLSFDIGHTAINYYYDYVDHNVKADIERHRFQVSQDLIATLKLLGDPEDYNQALAHQRLMAKINPHFLDVKHYEDFQQIRTQLNVEISRFGQRDVHDQFLAIERSSQEALIVQQNNFMAVMHELQAMQNGSEENANQLNLRMADKAQVDGLMGQLQAMGLETQENFHQLLIGNQAIRQNLQTFLSYVKHENQQKYLQAQKEAKASNYQGLMSACYFAAELGKITHCRELTQIANISQAGIQIYRNVEQLMASGLSGMALFGPVSAIGMSVIGVFSLFNQAPNPHQLILKQLARLSQQVTALHKDMVSHFQSLDERLSFMFNKIQEGFAAIERNTQLSVTKKLAEIQGELETLTKITKAGFQEALLEKLNQNVLYTASLKDGIIETITKENYEVHLLELQAFILEKSCIPLLNGTIYSHLLKPEAPMTSQLVSLLATSPPEALSGLLVYFAKYELNIPSFRAINEKNIFHPALWQIALETYMELKATKGHCYSYDPQGRNILRFKSQLDNFSCFIKQVQGDTTFYQIIFKHIAFHHEEVEKLISLFSEKKCVPYKPQFHLDIPKGILEHESAKKATKTFEKEFFNKLKIRLPKEFVVAADQRLGYFQYNFTIPEGSLRKKHHKHEGYSLKSGTNIGLELNFILGGQKIRLFKPSKNPAYKKTSLTSIYDHLIKNSTACYCDADLTTMRQVLDFETINRNKQTGSKMALCLNESKSYHSLLRLNYFLITYLKCAGLGDDLLAPVKKGLMLTDWVDLLETYVANPEGKTIPTVQISPVKNLQQIFTGVLATLELLKPVLPFSNNLLSLYSVERHLHGIVAQSVVTQTQDSFFNRPSGAGSIESNGHSLRY